MSSAGFCVSLFLLLVFIVLITNTVLSYSWLSYWLQQGHGVRHTHKHTVDGRPLPDIYRPWTSCSGCSV